MSVRFSQSNIDSPICLNNKGAMTRPSSVGIVVRKTTNLLLKCPHSATRSKVCQWRAHCLNYARRYFCHTSACMHISDYSACCALRMVLRACRQKRDGSRLVPRKTLPR